MRKRLQWCFIGVALLGAGAVVGRLSIGFRPENQKPGKFPEQVVFVRSQDDVLSGGVMFAAPRESSKPIAIIWIHGWGTNFYSPSYVGIGRALAERGFTTVSVNTRMHDIGNVEKHSFSRKRIRGGGYWGVTSEDRRDIAAWVAYAEQLGFARVVLAGHSAGWASVGRYQADSGDQRVVGLVLASGGVGDSSGPADPAEVAKAKQLVAEGSGEDLLRLPNRSFPSFISAATHLDIIETPEEYKDFFGTRITSPAVMRVHCPILAFFGTKGDVGGEKELALLKSSVQRLTSRPRRVDTAMIVGGDHMYVGEEAQVAQTISEWVDKVLLKQ